MGQSVKVAVLLIVLTCFLLGTCFASVPGRKQWCDIHDCWIGKDSYVYMLVEVSGVGPLPNGRYYVESSSDPDADYMQWSMHCGAFVLLLSKRGNQEVTWSYRVWRNIQAAKAKKSALRQIENLLRRLLNPDQ